MRPRATRPESRNSASLEIRRRVARTVGPGSSTPARNRTPSIGTRSPWSRTSIRHSSAIGSRTVPSNGRAGTSGPTRSSPRNARPSSVRSSTAVSPADCVSERPRYSSAPECTTSRSRPRRRRILGTTRRRARGGGPSGSAAGRRAATSTAPVASTVDILGRPVEGEVDRRTELLDGASVRETHPVSVRVRAQSGERDAHPLRGGLSDPHAVGLDHRAAFHEPEVQGLDGHRTARRRGRDVLRRGAEEPRIEGEPDDRGAKGDEAPADGEQEVPPPAAPPGGGRRRGDGVAGRGGGGAGARRGPFGPALDFVRRVRMPLAPHLGLAPHSGPVGGSVGRVPPRSAKPGSPSPSAARAEWRARAGSLRWPGAACEGAVAEHGDLLARAPAAGPVGFTGVEECPSGLWPAFTRFNGSYRLHGPDFRSRCGSRFRFAAHIARATTRRKRSTSKATAAMHPMPTEATSPGCAKLEMHARATTRTGPSCPRTRPSGGR